ncbi:hypothetical protein GCM10022251_68380 [Phytohabitans flavus]|uniref:Uncharacterized protein n=1 Tax=Phytohabitans flavus TaxID=1076124 RepID=A0A6F8XQS8_9ACTN|nr:hypothetical protein Pflav_025760 [Phytohabitans flavus]
MVAGERPEVGHHRVDRIAPFEENEPPLTAEAPRHLAHPRSEIRVRDRPGGRDQGRPVTERSQVLYKRDSMERGCHVPELKQALPKSDLPGKSHIVSWENDCQAYPQ